MYDSTLGRVGVRGKEHDETGVTDIVYFPQNCREDIKAICLKKQALHQLVWFKEGFY